SLPEPPRTTGTITFLLTEFVGSATCGEHLGAASAVVKKEYQARLRSVIGQHGGQELRSTEGSCQALFSRAADALAAAVTMQQCLATDLWPTRVGRPPVR